MLPSLVLYCCIRRNELEKVYNTYNNIMFGGVAPNFTVQKFILKVYDVVVAKNCTKDMSFL